MPILTLVIVLVVVGVGLWLINNFIPMQSQIKGLLNLVIVVAVIIWLLEVFGVLPPLSHFSHMRVGK